MIDKQGIRVMEHNPLLAYYLEHNISPVHQDIANFNIHMMRREKLYCQLGIPPIAFSGKRVLEVGPGGGCNALAMFVWGADIHFIEPNPVARQELFDLLKKYNVDRNRWEFFGQTIETLKTTNRYDIILAEGFIPSLTNQGEVIEKICSLVIPGGVVVVTCEDDISLFMEFLKKLVAIRLLKLRGAKQFDEKVRILANAFSPHLKKLQSASRPIEDWVTDQFLSPSLCGDLFSMADCLDSFSDEFTFLGSSPSLFTDYTWYKDVYYSKKDILIRQFRKKRHTLILYALEESERSGDANAELAHEIYELRKYAGDMEHTFEIANIIARLVHIRKLTKEIDSEIPRIIDETAQLLKDENLDEETISKAEHLARAFGRGQQYVSLVKRFSPAVGR